MSETAAIYEANIDVPAISDDRLLEVAVQAEKRIETVNKIKKLALKVTNAHDWLNQQGRPYLAVSGAEKVARLFGISWRIDEPVYESEEGGHYSYTYKGYFSLSGTTIEAIGSRSTKDKFFTKYGYENGSKTALPISEIDKGDIKKAAYTNCIGNGITRLLGIRNLTWEDLAEAGIKGENLSKVEYKKEGKAVDRDIASDESNTATVIITDVKKKTGEKNGKTWVNYIIRTADAEYKTFSESFAKFALEAKNHNQPVKITYKQTKFGNDIENIAMAPSVSAAEEEDGDVA